MRVTNAARSLSAFLKRLLARDRVDESNCSLSSGFLCIGDLFSSFHRPASPTDIDESEEYCPVFHLPKDCWQQDISTSCDFGGSWTGSGVVWLIKNRRLYTLFIRFD